MAYCDGCARLDRELRALRESGDRHARIYEAAARIAAGLRVAYTDEQGEPTTLSDEVIARDSVSLALCLDAEVRRRLEEE